MFVSVTFKDREHESIHYYFEKENKPTVIHVVSRVISQDKITAHQA